MTILVGLFRENAKVLRGNAIGISREWNNISRERNMIARERNSISRERNNIIFHMTLQGLRKISLYLYLKKDTLAQELISKLCVYNFFNEVSYFGIKSN